MSAKSGSKNKGKKPLETTLGKAPVVPKDTIDVAHLRKPIDTSVAGVNEILKLYETATDEVQRYITYECDIMYECRTCRTIFRSLANLILHKRDYCRELYYTKCKSSLQKNDETELDAIFNKEPSSSETTSSPRNCDVNKSSPSPLQSLFLSTNGGDGKKDLDSVLSFLQNKQSNSLITEQYLNEDISQEMSSISDIGSSNNLPFQRTVDSRFISLQTMFENLTSNSNSENSVTNNMKTEVREIRNMLENNRAVLDSDGKIIEAKSTKDSNFLCNVCNQKFVTEKTLTFHIKYKHNSSKLLYKCPLCNNTFANTWGVFRHLYKLHNKTTAQVKKMRSQIHYNVIRRDEIPQVENCESKESSTNLEILKQWMKNIEEKEQRCGGCWRKFDRKAALNSHIKGCLKRALAFNNVKETKKEERRIIDEKQVKVGKINKCVGSQRRKTTLVSKATNVTQECHSKISEKLEEVDEESQRHKAPLFSKVTNVTQESPSKISEKLVEAVDEGSQDYKTTFVSKATNVTQECALKISEKLEEEVDKQYIIEKHQEENDKQYLTTDLKINTKLREGIDSSLHCTINLKSSENLQVEIDKQHCVVSAKISEKLQEEIDKEHCIIKSFSEKAAFEMIRFDDCKKPFCGFDNSVKVESIKLLDVEKSENCPSGSVDVFRGFFLPEPIEISSDSSVENIVVPIQHFKEETTDDLLTEKCTCDSGYDPGNCEVIISDVLDNSNLEVEVIPNAGRFEKENFDLIRKRARSPKELESRKKFKSEDKDESDTLTLEMKSLNYINKERRCCLPCKKEFKSNGCLMKHMASHFKWYRYACTKCNYKSYSKSKCENHIELKHRSQESTKTFIKRLSIVQTLEFCSDTIIIKNKGKVDEPIKCKAPVKSPEENHNDSTVFSMLDIGHSFLNSISPENKESNSDDSELTDASLKNMIIGVILGFDKSKEDSVCNNATSNLNESENKVTSSTSEMEVSNESLSEIEESLESFEDVNCLKSRGCIETVPIFQDSLRPIRNRVQTIQKDFVYNMKELLKPNIIKDVIVSNKETTAQKKNKNLKTYFNKTKRGGKLPPTSESYIVVSDSNLTEDVVSTNSNLILPEHVTGD